MRRKEHYLVSLDVGTSKTAAIVAEATEDGGLDIIGIGVAEAQGIRRGVVVNLEAAVESIKKAIEEAELTAGVEIDSVHLGLSGAHLKAFNSRGVVAVAGKNREITREDVRRAIDDSRKRHRRRAATSAILTTCFKRWLRYQHAINTISTLQLSTRYKHAIKNAINVLSTVGGKSFQTRTQFVRQNSTRGCV